MASNNIKYIFGEFSPDEFNQFFVTSRSSVELPPFNDKVLHINQSAGDGNDSDIEENDSEPPGLQSNVYKVSSTLNPQAPEFILGYQPAQKSLDNLSEETAYSSIDCQFGEGNISLDSGNCQGNDDLAYREQGPRERRNKKKRPPGYYNYQEGVSDAGSPTEALDLVNGHVLNPGLNANSSEEVELLDQKEIPESIGAISSKANQRTCESPENDADFISGAFCNDSASSALDEARTAEQPGFDVEANTEANNDEATVEVNSTEQFGLLETERSSPVRTAVAQSCAGTDINVDAKNEQTLESSGDSTVTHPSSSVGAGLHTDSTECEQDKPEDVCSVEPEQTALAPSTASAAPLPAKSWASLFHNSKPTTTGPMAYVEAKFTPTNASVQFPEKQPEMRIDAPVPVSEDSVAQKIAELLETVKLVHKPVSLQPRGLINKSNWCYINATLQALVACPPMYHLMKSIPMFNETQRPRSSTPMIDSFVRLMNEFSTMPIPSKTKPGTGDKSVKDIRTGIPFEPTYIYRLLTVIKSSLSEKGRQEDAEEYLGFILNGLHEEMLTLKKLVTPQDEKNAVSNGPESQQGAEEVLEEQGEGSEDEWEQVGPRNKTSVTRQADFIRTPITDVFGGHVRSVVYQQSSKESATLQLFFSLQLDTQSEKIRTVQDALESLVARESVQGYTTKTKQEVEICRRVTLEELPPVLVLHLKRFIYEKTGGCQKPIKNIDYPIDLEISKDLLSPGVKSKISKVQRTYRLFAVVYHHGNSATGGHYTTDVFHIGLNGWLRIDDQIVKVINQYHVVKPSAERTAYLLYYRRVDLL
ncbi:ubiquitin carboxyl-terminal hydrolase 10 isoform X2 [Leucoraja erinacea]|uniref:ubiquitin carboxyl-terminal hydrolase 10 isoform X2 n=1 Tax=Leucoraja erinaceus TaxID=7782 RepID=UPI002455A6CA|nr:ubiquitin carboxyl-terminal hydrolase 10 isoform X2 [Leucoraja erinacea]